MVTDDGLAHARGRYEHADIARTQRVRGRLQRESFTADALVFDLDGNPMVA
ncbi:MAG TPA: hypothetical protein VK803_00895 [Steroidobacteraceae bacterium]|nr:hypothetical protein [Steroidobacteraceae bacterium]